MHCALSTHSLSTLANDSCNFIVSNKQIKDKLGLKMLKDKPHSVTRPTHQYAHKSKGHHTKSTFTLDVAHCAALWCITVQHPTMTHSHFTLDALPLWCHAAPAMQHHVVPCSATWHCFRCEWTLMHSCTQLNSN